MQSRVLTGGANALLLLISITVALGILEIAVRLILPTYDPSGRVRFVRLSDGTPIGLPDRVLRQVKNTGDYDVEVRFNSWGFRDDKPLTSAVSDDLFVVGDSFAFGWGVDTRDRFSDRLQ